MITASNRDDQLWHPSLDHVMREKNVEAHHFGSRCCRHSWRQREQEGRLESRSSEKMKPSQPLACAALVDGTAAVAK